MSELEIQEVKTTNKKYEFYKIQIYDQSKEKWKFLDGEYLSLLEAKIDSAKIALSLETNARVISFFTIEKQEFSVCANENFPK